MRRYEIRYTETCAACNGTGMVQHPAWTQYWSLYPVDDYADEATIAARMAEFGWFCPRTSLRVSGYVLPPEEEACDECEGAGMLTGTCELREALADMTSDLSAIVKRIVTDAAYNAQLSAELADAQAFAQAWDR